MQIEETAIISPALDHEKLVDAEACAAELKTTLTQALACAARVVGYKELSVRHAINCGYILLRAKDLVPHGEFMQWCETNANDIGRETCRKWMGLANSHKNGNLDLGADATLSLAYKKTFEGSEPKEEGDAPQKDKPPFSLSFKTDYNHVSEWSRDAARDFLYEFDRIARIAVQLKTEFGL